MEKDVFIYFDLITSLKTVQEVDDLASEIDNLQASLFTSSKMSLSKAINEISRATGKKIIDIFSKNNLDMNDKKLIADFLETLKDLIKKFKVIKLILAFDPSLKTIANIHEQVLENLGFGYILDIEIDERVLAGGVVIFNGKYKDFTLRKSLEQTFLTKREEIMKLSS